MCNCSPNPANICTQCQSGNPCGCPPDYSIAPLPVPCGCCPDGYTFVGPTPNYPSGYCQRGDPKSAAAAIVPPIPCNNCPETIQSDCVILPAIPCLGIAAGTTLTSLLGFLCSSAFAEVILKAIAADPAVGSGFCQLVQNCPPVGSGTTPIITGIIITFP